MTNSPLEVIERFGSLLDAAEGQVMDDVRAYWEWRTNRKGSSLDLSWLDDADIRSYLLHLKIIGVDGPCRARVTNGLERLYAWAKSESILSMSPFETYAFDKHLLSRDQIRRRTVPVKHTPVALEMDRLRALNRLADELNRSSSIPSMLDAAVHTLTEVTGLPAAWAFLWRESGLTVSGITADAPHDFVLAAHYGLPPGLVRENHHFLCRAPDCRCQVLMRAGRLVRAVNVVECSRLEAADEANTDTEDLYYHGTVPLIAGGQSIGLLNFATENWEFLNASDLQMLTAAGNMIATAVQRADLYHVIEAQRERLAGELELARRVQASLIPSQLPTLQEYTLAAEWRAANEVAGDFYDVIELAGGHIAFVLADVSGKGAPAALYMAMVRSMIRVELGHQASPMAVLRAVNRRLLEEASSHMFVTVFLAILNPAEGQIVYCIAGHDPPLVRNATGIANALPTGGHFLGVFENPDLEDCVFQIRGGESLLAYTDGLTDTMDADGQQYGTTRLTESLHGAPTAANDMLRHVLSDLESFRRATPPIDDVTVLVISRE